MQQKINFYNILYKQINIMIILSLLTAPVYIFLGWFYSESILYESIWLSAMVVASIWGNKLYKQYINRNFTTIEKTKWEKNVNIFFFFFFTLWNLIFIIYIFKSNQELHYIAIATQVGTLVVASTLLASQKRLAQIVVITLVSPLLVYFVALGEYFSYILAFFGVVLTFVILYSSRNTYKLIVENEHQAYHDHLTELPNRRYLTEYLQSEMEHEKNFTKRFFMLLIDLDHFKTVNDTLGHDVGDKLLVEVAKRVSDYCEKNDCKAFRIGGDEFSVLSPPCSSDNSCLIDARGFAEDLLSIIKEKYILQEHSVYISASIGVSLINNKNIDINTFVKEADIAMYEAKSKGRNALIVFNNELSQRIERRLDIERLLHFAIDSSEIYLNYQPQVDIYEKVIGCEVLVRWRSKKLGFVPPDEFISIAEHTGIIIELGYYILEESFKALKSFDDEKIELTQFSINISMRQLFHPGFLEDVRYLIEKHLDEKLAKKLLFEITETSVSEDMIKLSKNMEILRSYGIRFSMDDFGTGYSSLSYLRQIPLYELKIDKSFIAEIANTKQSTIVKTILNIAKNLKLKTVAEGVENSFHKDFLIENDCDVLQGYYFSKPLSRDDFVKFCRV